LTARHEADDEGAEPQVLMHMQRQHRQRETNDQKGDRDNAHDRKQRGHRTALRSTRTHNGAVAFLFLDLSRCGARFQPSSGRLFRGNRDDGGVYGQVIEQVPMCRHCPFMRLASKMRMDLSAMPQ
jgi:hypothetical protein